MTLVLKVDCRACNRECGDYKHLLDETVIDDESTTLAALLHYCTTLECFGENHTSGMPEHICNSCVEHLLQSYLFKEMVLQNDKAYRERLIAEAQQRELNEELKEVEVQEEVEIVEQEIDVGGVEESADNIEFISENEEIVENDNEEAEFEYEEWLEIDDVESQINRIDEMEPEQTINTENHEEDENSRDILVKNEAGAEDCTEYFLSNVNDNDSDNSASEELKGFDDSKDSEEKEEKSEAADDGNVKEKDDTKSTKRKSVKVSLTKF